MRTTAASISLGLQQALMLPFMALYAADGLGLSPVGVAWFLVAFHGSGMVMSIIVTAIADRRQKPMLSLRVVTLCAISAFLIFAVIDDVAVLVVVIVVLLGPSSAQNGLYFAHLRRTAEDGERMVSHRGLFSLAWVLGPVLGALLIQFGGYSALFGALAGVNVTVYLLLRPFRDESIGSRRHPVMRRPTPREPLRLLWAFIALVFLSGTNVIATTTTPLVMVHELDAGVATSGIVFGFCALLEALCFMALARWGVQYDPRLIVLLGCVPGALYYVGLSLASHWFEILALQVLNAAFIVSSVGAGMVWFQNLMPRDTGLATAIFLNTARVAGVAAAPLIGTSARMFGSYQPVTLLGAALLAVPVAILFSLRAAERAPRPPAQQ